MIHFSDKQKAIDHALWLNFQNRTKSMIYGVIHGPEDDWVVLDTDTSLDMEMPFLDVLPDSLSKLSYQHIEAMRIDSDPLGHWEQIHGMFSRVNGEVLRFILLYEIPLNKLIRYELSIRGHDENSKWCGFERAKEIWLK